MFCESLNKYDMTINMKDGKKNMVRIVRELDRNKGEDVMIYSNENYDY